MADKKTPQIRFKGFSDDWEQCKLGDFGSVAMCKRIFKNQTTDKGDVPFYKIGTFGGEPDAYISKELFEEYKQLYSYPEKGDILISASGSIGRTVEYKGEDAYYQDSNIVWLKHDKTIVNSFLKYLYEVIQWAGIEGSTIKRLYNDNILKTEVIIPSAPEQKKIGSFFASLDRLVALHQRELEKLKILKKSMLENCFPKNGEKVPKVRFAGFTGDWEQRKVQQLIDNGVIEAPMDGNHGEKHPKASDYVPYGIPFLMAADIKNGKADLHNCKFISKERSERLDKGFAKNGDVLITHKATIGETALLQGLTTEYAVLTPQVTYYRVSNKVKLSPLYLYACFQSPHFQREMSEAAGQSTRAYIGIQQQHDLSIYMPINIKEQEAIGLFFFDLDNLITLHQSKLDKLQIIKKSMLEKMFV